MRIFKTLVLTALFLILIVSGCAGQKNSKPGNELSGEKTSSDNGDQVPKEGDDSSENSNSGDSAIRESTQEEGISKPGKENFYYWDEVMIENKISEMNMDEKIGQMFIVGFDGVNPNNKITDMIQNQHAGGVILFQRNIGNPEQLLALNNALKNINMKSYAMPKESIPLFLSVDEEGGSVSRLPEQLRKLPTALSVGEINDKGFSYHVGSLLAEEIKMFGFNVNYAPVLDVWSNPENTVIGDRAFGTNPNIVSDLGIETMKGIRDAGIIPVVKHFPGHGNTVVDSHIGLPKVDYDLNRLNDFELVPFKSAIENQADVVMIAHILMTSIDPENPATLSKKIVTDILRKQMGFSGVVITDDMTMGAIKMNYDIGDAAVKSVLAGSDIILVCHGYDKQMEALNAVKDGVKNGTISEDRINESVSRILELKKRYKLNDQPSDMLKVDKINKKIDALIAKWYNR